ncbi:hypothetical protein FA743_19075 [Paracoccus gahaiensis]|uniref:Uncharacterized protein n=1 Tax=Paracoccus gahaiensis TaxID=1706839 RepID=A0A4U0R3L7_9RHOB|nr:hypothetical protein [Paracoccus gahaiensis]TJZ89317.1 hypothetical protein FA743_19075 [Paracoccus gahaiensis]
MLEALVSVTAENTTTLIDVQHQAAATAASVKDARTYMATVVKNTDWETNGKKIAAILDKALLQDRTALHAVGEAARDMRGTSIEITHRAVDAAVAQKDASKAFDSAAERLLRVLETHQQGRWRRVGIMVLIGALCGAVGFFAREPATRFQHLWDAGVALKLDAADADCKTLGGRTMPSGDEWACVIWQDPDQ